MYVSVFACLYKLLFHEPGILNMGFKLTMLNPFGQKSFICKQNSIRT